MSNNFIKRLASAAAKMGHVAKDGKNTFHRYDYVTHDDVSALVRGPLFQEGIAMTYEIVKHEIEDGTSSKNKPQRIHTLHGKVIFHDSESERTLSSDFIGQSMDREDKGVNKALSSGIKYALMKTFLIPSGDPEEDTEHPSHDQRRMQSQNQHSRTPAPPPRKVWADLTDKQKQHYAIKRSELSGKIAWGDKYPNGYESWIETAGVLEKDPSTGKPSFGSSFVDQVERVIKFLEKQAEANPKPALQVSEATRKAATANGAIDPRKLDPVTEEQKADVERLTGEAVAR